MVHRPHSHPRVDLGYESSLAGCRTPWHNLKCLFFDTHIPVKSLQHFHEAHLSSCVCLTVPVPSLSACDPVRGLSMVKLVGTEALSNTSWGSASLEFVNEELRCDLTRQSRAAEAFDES